MTERLLMGRKKSNQTNKTGQKYCGMIQLEHSAILSTFIKLTFAIKIFVLSIFKWPFYTGFIVALNVTI